MIFFNQGMLLLGSNHPPIHAPPGVRAKNPPTITSATQETSDAQNNNSGPTTAAKIPVPLQRDPESSPRRTRKKRFASSKPRADDRFERASTIVTEEPTMPMINRHHVSANLRNPHQHLHSTPPRPPPTNEPTRPQNNTTPQHNQNRPDPNMPHTRNTTRPTKTGSGIPPPVPQTKTKRKHSHTDPNTLPLPNGHQPTTLHRVPSPLRPARGSHQNRPRTTSGAEQPPLHNQPHSPTATRRKTNHTH